MQFKFISSLLLASITMVAAQMKSVVITFPKNAPDSVLNDAKQAIIDAVRSPSILSLLPGGRFPLRLTDYLGGQDHP